MRKLLLLTLIFSLNSFAQELSGIRASFVDVGFGAKPMGMGGTYVSVSDDINSVVWNPAGLNAIHNIQTTFTFTKVMSMVDYHFLAIAFPLKFYNFNSIGFALIASGDEALREYTFQTSVSGSYKRIEIGFTVKVRYATFGNNTLNPADFIIFEPDEVTEGINNQVKGDAVGFGFDLGFLFNVTDKMKFGLMIKDIYAPMFWNSKTNNSHKNSKGSYNEYIPYEIVVGSSFRLLENVILAGQFSPKVLDDQTDKFGAGLEIEIMKILYLRAGTQYFINNLPDEKLYGGIGFKIDIQDDLTILTDFAYAYEQIKNSLRFSLGINF